MTKTDPLSRTGPAPRAPVPGASSHRTPSSHQNPVRWHRVWNTLLCLARGHQPPPPACAPSWSPVKINPVLAKPRT